MLIRHHIILAGLLIFFTGLAIGQQWRPLISNEKFNFRIDSAGYISNSIWVDSVKIENGDSVFYLNRIVTKCDTCTNGSGSEYWRLCNQPQFLKKKMILKTGGLYIFQEPGKYYLKTLAPLNASWVFDSVANITAQIVDKSYELVFTVYDSIKTIHLSNGDTILFSKNNGILKFPDLKLGQHYHLEGIEGRNVGIVIPKFADFFNFNVGDVFQYSSNWHSYAVPPEGGGGLQKVTITSRDSSSGYYTYEATVIGCYWPDYMGMHGDTSHYYETNTLIYQDSITHFCNYYPLQIMEDQVDVTYAGQNSSYIFITKDTNNLIKKSCGTGNPNDPNLLYIHGSYLSPPYPFEILIPNSDIFLREFITGLGMTRDYLMIFESQGDRELIGYVKNGDTLGTVYPDDVILESIKEKDNKNLCKIYPNPARDKVFISFEKIPEDHVVVELFSLDGRMVLKTLFEKPSETMETDVHGLYKGMYFIKIHSNENDFVTKLIIH
jgi:hypothetical protein